MCVVGSNGKVGTEVSEAYKVLVLQSNACNFFGCHLNGEWAAERCICADNFILNILMFTGPLGEQQHFTTWHFTSLCWAARESTNYTNAGCWKSMSSLGGWGTSVAVRSDCCFISSCPKVVSSSMWGDDDTIQLLFDIKKQLDISWRQCWADKCLIFWWEWKWAVWVVL